MFKGIIALFYDNIILMNEKFVLAGRSLNEIKDFVLNLKMSSFRASQIFSWIYLKSVKTIDDMTDLSLSARELLKENAVLSNAFIKDKQISSDGTIKFLFQYPDGVTAEAVLMRFDNRAALTACISSQSGCPMGCAFCATAKLGFIRNLTAEEITAQIYLIQADTGLRAANIVYMGQGEPLLNFENVSASIQMFRDYFQIGARRITISTCGIIPGIKKLAELDCQSRLAVSLHAPNQTVRETIMPVSKKYNYADLISALKEYTQITGRRVTIEYVLIKDVNDSFKAAKELAENIAALKCNVNLIIYNSHEYSSFKEPDAASVQKFKYILEASGKKVTIRLERGADIAAACGQLSAKSAAL